MIRVAKPGTKFVIGDENEDLAQRMKTFRSWMGGMATAHTQSLHQLIYCRQKCRKRA
ncbi:MAG: hypothetical protein ABSA01_11300 [Anaerolineales bacterium]|jgi:hypothetical protein